MWSILYYYYHFFLIIIISGFSLFVGVGGIGRLLVDKSTTYDSLAPVFTAEREYHSNAYSYNAIVFCFYT